MFPLEVITMLGSGLMSGVMAIWSKSIEDRRATQEMLIRQRESQRAGYRDARTHQSPGFSITRRIIALMCVFSIIVLPLVVGAFTSTEVTYGYTEFKPGFLFFSGKEIVKWVTFKGGFVLTPLHTHVVSAILGLYFGHSIVKR